MKAAVAIRRARSIEDYSACVAIQRDVWAFPDPADYASVPLMRVQNTYGGSVLVAGDAGGRVQGFAFALLSRNLEGTVFWWSHMTAVSAESAGKGIGFALKMAQRNEALRQGISEIAWTFDPLQAKNAHFNIRKLGVVAFDYEENFYGPSSSPLHANLPTDRLRVAWTLSSERVVDRVSGTSSLILRDFDGIVRVLESRDGVPGPPDLAHRETPMLLEIPAAYPQAGPGKSGSAREWQEKLRATFSHYLGQGYAVTDFIRVETPRPQAFYVLERT